MQKKVIALAVAAAMAAPLAAQAEATLYGKAHVTLTNYSGDIIDSGLNVTSNASRIGVKGSEDLGNGLKAVYGMEWQIDMADASTNAASASTGTLSDSLGETITGAVTSISNTTHISSRNMFAGLSGGFGTVILGRHDTPYKMSTGSLDLFADTAADYNAIIGSPVGLENRGNNVIAYISPDFSGVSVAVAGVAAENGDDTFAATSASVTYKAGPLLVAAAAEDFKDSHQGTRLGVGYNFGAGTVGFVYETAKDDADTFDTTGYLVNGSFGLGGGNTLIAEYGKISDDVSDADRKLMALGVAHGFTKATSAYAAVGKLDDDGADENILTLGLVHSF